MKKLLIILAIIFSLALPAGAFSQTFNHSHSEYSQILSSDVYPSINNYIEELKISQPLDQQSSQVIAKDVATIIVLSLKQKKLTTLFPPAVNVLKMTNPVRDVYMLEVTLIFFDGEESIKDVLVTTMMFGKRFVLFVDEKAKIEA